MKRNQNKSVSVALAMACVLATANVASASSHREAPAIAEDQFADNTDVYAFISPENPDNLVMVANYVPLLLPASGPNFYRFSDSVRYEICLDNDGDARRDVCYQWRFNTRIANGQTFLYNVGPIASIDDANLNVQQTYDIVRFDFDRTGRRTRRTRSTVASDVPVAPWNVGSRSFPSGSYERVASQAIHEEGGIRAFAGPRDEPFFVDLHVFDLLGVGGAPTTDGVNVMSLVLEVPIADLTASGARPAADDSSPESP